MKFSSQVDAKKAAREFFWGSVRNVPGQTLAEMKADPKLDTPLGWFGVYVTANVNGHDVLIGFDTFGRQTELKRVN